MGKGVELIGKALEVAEAGIPSLVFGVLEVICDIGSAGCANGGSTLGAVIGDGRHMRTGQQVTT